MVEQPPPSTYMDQERLSLESRLRMLEFTAATATHGRRPIHRWWPIVREAVEVISDNYCTLHMMMQAIRDSIEREAP